MIKGFIAVYHDVFVESLFHQLTEIGFFLGLKEDFFFFGFNEIVAFEPFADLGLSYDLAEDVVVCELDSEPVKGVVVFEEFEDF